MTARKRERLSETAQTYLAQRGFEQRDWRIDTVEIPEYVDRPRFAYVTEVESYRDRVRRMRTWNWLCGQDTEMALRWETSRPVSELGG